MGRTGKLGTFSWGQNLEIFSQVHVRKFQPFEEEFAKRNGSPRVRRPTRHEGERNQQTADIGREGEEEGSGAFPTNGWDSRYFTSPMYDL